MFGPVLWLVLSSFKTGAALNEFPPQLLPYGQAVVSVPGFDNPRVAGFGGNIKAAGFDNPLPLFRVKLPDGQERVMAEARRIGIIATMVDPKAPGEEAKVNIKDRQRVREFRLATENYTDVFGKFAFARFLWNTVFITVIATLITVLINAMAAFALSKYKFSGQKWVFLLIISTLMIPPPDSRLP